MVQEPTSTTVRRVSSRATSGTCYAYTQLVTLVIMLHTVHALVLSQARLAP